MSVPSYSILCTQCDYESSSNATSSHYYYRDDEGQFNCSEQLGWCDGCRSITAIEDFGDTAEAAAKIKSELEHIRRDTGTVFASLLNMLFSSRRRWLSRSIETINNHAKYIQLAQKRAGQERCLKCGSHVVEPYKPTKGGGDLKVQGFMYHGQCKTDVVHPGCGGMFYEKAHKMRFSMVSYSKFYTTDGAFIESCYEKSMDG